jgi:protocatechuate 3,4-dioxygenase beta subunit
MKNKFRSFAALAAISTTTLIVIPTSQAASCVATQALTEGPYYSTDTPVRTNIAPGEVGTKTKITITVVDSKCKAVKGAKVDIWHANAAGKYSAVEGVSGNFARGTQVTNASGKVTFTSIYPGWYPGRTMHIHFKIWRNGSEVLTSQFFASDAENAKIYQSGVYASRGNQNTPLAADRIYGSLKNPASLTLKLSIGSTISGTAKVVI